MRVFLSSPCYDTTEPEFVGPLIASMGVLRASVGTGLDNDATTRPSAAVAW